jgi:hypothetical protein
LRFRAKLRPEKPKNRKIDRPSTRASALPEQMVAGDGTVNVPFAGAVPVAGKGLCGQRAGGGAAEVPQYSDFVVVLGEQSGESGKLILC